MDGFAPFAPVVIYYITFLSNKPHKTIKIQYAIYIWSMME